MTKHVRDPNPLGISINAPKMPNLEAVTGIIRKVRADRLKDGYVPDPVRSVV